jgi:hypothetical protein
MIKLTRNQLQNLIMSCDTNNPKYELNFIYIDKENAVSTQTRAITIVEHNQKTEEMWLHVSLAKKAITDKKATHFIIESNNSIISVGIDEFHIMRYSIDLTDYTYSTMRFPDYKRIVPNSFTKSNIPFTDSSQINGILALDEINVNPKYLPLIEEGYISYNGSSMPVMIKDSEEIITHVVMPIINDRFKELKDYLKKTK